jgi:protein ImuB
MSARAELYACLYVREFPAQVLMRLRPELRERAVVVMEGEKPLETVCALNARARQMGVERGMTRVEVETFEGISVLQRAAAEEESARAVLLQCAGTFSPRVEERAGGSAFVCVIDIAGTAKLFGPPMQLAKTLLSRMRALGIAATVAVSSNFEAAVCHARGRPGQTAVIPQGIESIALAPLPIDVLELSEEHAATFAMWGIHTLGELGTLPEKELIARLGQEGRRLRQIARGELPHLFVPVEPAFRLEERMELDAPVEVLESLLFVMSVMLEQLVLRATARVLALAQVTVTLELEGGGTHVRTVRPALPSNQRAMWLKLVQMDLEAHPPGAAVVGIVLTAEPGTTSKVQMGLFSPQLPEAMKLDVTLARIKAIVGEECVGRPVLKNTHRPDGFGVEPFVVTAGAVKSTERAPAAMRVVRPAERVSMVLRGTQPAGFTFREVLYEVERAYGPWVMSGDWWNPTLWGMEQWDLIARGRDGAVVCCCVVLDGIEQVWKMVGLYD